MSEKHDIVAAIREHNALCASLLALVEEENQALAQGRSDLSASTERAEEKRALLQQLDAYRDQVRGYREQLEQEGESGANLAAEINSAIEEGKQVIMKVVTLDRENEKHLLRLGRLAPGNLPSADARRPDLVAKTYRA